MDNDEAIVSAKIDCDQSEVPDCFILIDSDFLPHAEEESTD